MAKLVIGMVAFEQATNLDFTGPLEVFGKLAGCEVQICAKTRDLVACEGLSVIRPTVTFADCPQVDVLFVPGGPGQIDVMTDDETIGFVARQGQAAQWVTAVCTGSLILGAAGLLQGYRAACHWMSRDQLPLFGAEPVNQRVVFDRNRVTGGGVTAGIDFGFALAARLVGDPAARRLQLALEYAPEPPFDCGLPERADPDTVTDLLGRAAGLLERRWAASRTAADRLNQRGTGQ
ncbi:DJ-1/PfpI family protein [Pararhodobacter aggregans]|uniref:Thiamine biosynthesis protein ThiJ n=1 Tax=Pararhodobacter aggregans TaxID=404875 RepID=A0A2T7UTA2_9RHOB|nr:DJ-1/PfpI family protein [Pararhodobacter aggregans]PTX03522.1 cyclohexyl-isocyanide hydratase [Pararhodobacter aggregans]PVE47808.1 thiamine biosynthesis protein ThiJ [Pararhodobacter aggregans]